MDSVTIKLLNGTLQPTYMMAIQFLRVFLNTHAIWLILNYAVSSHPELRNGVPALSINHGSGTLTLQLPPKPSSPTAAGTG